MSEPSKDRPPTSPPSRRPYRPPELVEYGSIAARTLSTATGSFTDPMSQLMIMS